MDRKLRFVKLRFVDLTVHLLTDVVYNNTTVCRNAVTNSKYIRWRLGKLQPRIGSDLTSQHFHFSITLDLPTQRGAAEFQRTGSCIYTRTEVVEGYNTTIRRTTDENRRYVRLMSQKQQLQTGNDGEYHHFESQNLGPQHLHFSHHIKPSSTRGCQVQGMIFVKLQLEWIPKPLFAE